MRTSSLPSVPFPTRKRSGSFWMTASSVPAQISSAAGGTACPTTFRKASGSS